MYDLRKLHFPPDTPPGAPVVVFFMLGEECYFTAVGDQKSSLECSDLIVETIVRQTGIPLARLRLFELLTHMGSELRNGDYRFGELVLGASAPAIVSKWRVCAPPSFVRKVFGSLIGRAQDR